MWGLISFFSRYNPLFYPGPSCSVKFHIVLCPALLSILKIQEAPPYACVVIITWVCYSRGYYGSFRVHLTPHSPSHGHILRLAVSSSSARKVTFSGLSSNQAWWYLPLPLSGHILRPTHCPWRTSSCTGAAPLCFVDFPFRCQRTPV